MKVHVYIVTLVLFVCISVRLQAGDRNEKKAIIFCGKLWNGSLNGQTKRKIEFVVVNNFSLPLTSRAFNTQSYEVDIVNDSFYTSIPCPSKYIYVQFRDFDDKLINNRGDIYLFCPGDSTHFSYNENYGVNISGRNVNKFICQLDLDKAYVKLSPFSMEVENSHYLAYAKETGDKLLNKGLDILKGYYSKMDTNLYKILKLNFICRAKIKLINSYNLKFIFDSKQNLKKALEYFSILHNETVNADSSTWVNSSNYLYYLHSKDWLYIRAQSILKYNLDTAFVLMFKSIKRNYKSILRDRLIAYHFIKSLRDYGTSIALVNQALQFTNDKYSRKLLLNLKAMQPGVMSHEIDFVDSAGKRYTLKDFAGKTTIFHLWFLGCHGCLDLKKEMESITGILKEDSDVVFVSVNADTERNKWIKGLNLKSYGSERDINLFAKGQGINHPFLKYYQFSAFPQMFIIDKNGRIISANPPRPDGKENICLFLSLIGKQINENIEEIISKKSE